MDDKNIEALIIHYHYSDMNALEIERKLNIPELKKERIEEIIENYEEREKRKYKNSYMVYLVGLYILLVGISISQNASSKSILFMSFFIGIFLAIRYVIHTFFKFK